MNETISTLQTNLQNVIKGKDECVDMLLAAMLAGGHVLIEDLPGVGKTTLAKSLALSVHGTFKRIQFTPDLLPTDILGGSVYNPKEGTFSFHKGPVFTNILLADEVNRASPRTQSSLLEAMAERQVSIEGVTHPLPELFMVIGTQNPVEFHGTYPLPEAQLDRFLIRMEIGYPSDRHEHAMLYDQQLIHPTRELKPVTDCEQVAQLQDKVRHVHVDEALGQYIVDIVNSTRNHPELAMGVSPRGSLGLFRFSQALALMSGRDHVMPEDIQAATVPVLSHRVVLQTQARYGGTNKSAIIDQVVDGIPVPR